MLGSSLAISWAFSGLVFRVSFGSYRPKENFDPVPSSFGGPLCSVRISAELPATPAVPHTPGSSRGPCLADSECHGQGFLVRGDARSQCRHCRQCRRTRRIGCGSAPRHSSRFAFGLAVGFLRCERTGTRGGTSRFGVRARTRTLQETPAHAPEQTGTSWRFFVIEMFGSVASAPRASCAGCS